MTVEDYVFGIAMATVLVAWILYVLFGQITVRKLRKNSELRYELGTELISGWDIFNVAEALSLPRSLMDKFKNSRLSMFYANPDLLRKHTNWFDKLLAQLFFWPFLLSGTTLIGLVIFDSLRSLIT